MQHREPQSQDPEQQSPHKLHIRSRKFRVEIPDADGDTRQTGSHDDTDDLFYVLATASTDEYDSYNSRMDSKTTLKNMRDALKTGVPILEAHNYYRGMPLGQSVNGTLKRNPNRVVAEFFITKGMGLSGSFYSSSDTIIRAIRTAAIRDVSVGIWGGEDICDICGLNITNWWRDYYSGNDYCPHIPGEEYEIVEGEAPVLCTYTIVDAELLELSLVWAGANPSAEIIEKAESLLACTPEHTDRLLPHLKNIERQYGYRFPSPAEARDKHKALLLPQSPALSRSVSSDAEEPTEPEEPTADAAPVADALLTGEPTMDALQYIEKRIQTIRQTHSTLPEDPIGAFEHMNGMLTSLQAQVETLNTQVSEQAAELRTLTDTHAEVQKASDAAVAAAEAVAVEKTEAYDAAEAARQEAETVVAELTKRAEDAETEVGTLTETVATMETQVAENTAVREALIGRGKAAAVQIHGDEYTEEHWDKTFETLPAIEMQRQVEEMETAARAKFQGGKRVKDADDADDADAADADADAKAAADADGANTRSADPLDAAPRKPGLHTKHFV